MLLGLRPGLLEKYNSSNTAAAKFAFLKAFILDPQSLGSITIESEYVERASRDEDSNWAEVALCNLRKEYSSDAGKKFLEDKIVGEQEGRPHPQDPNNPEMRLYWVFRENIDSTKSHRSVGTKISGKGTMPANKAAQGALCDTLTAHATDFKGKGSTKGVPESTEKGRGRSKGKKGGKGKGKGSDNTKVSRLFFLCFFRGFSESSLDPPL